ncbi:hypothetical protein D3C71_881610 [compost metagenome]
MNFKLSIELMKKYSKCPVCGSDKIGGGAGTIEIVGETFKRTCSCGWSVEISNDNQKGE